VFSKLGRYGNKGFQRGGAACFLNGVLELGPALLIAKVRKELVALEGEPDRAGTTNRAFRSTQNRTRHQPRGDEVSEMEILNLSRPRAEVLLFVIFDFREKGADEIGFEAHGYQESSPLSALASGRQRIIVIVKIVSMRKNQCFMVRSTFRTVRAEHGSTEV
jgi:hypothetical protein